jgi:hypothetical protein
MTISDNPYASPQTETGPALVTGETLSDAEATRRKYLNHEASVKSIGSLYYTSGPPPW